MFGIPSTSPLNRAALLTALVLLGGARPGSADSGGPNIPRPAQIAQARTLCSEIVGVRPGDNHFSGCVASLAASLHSARQEHAIIEARSACFAQGLRPGGTELSLCLLNASAAHALTEDTESGNDQADGASALPTSLGNISDRERQACARTGFDPAFGAFANCIADLQSALQNTDMPTN